jgi:hypothetical protein
MPVNPINLLKLCEAMEQVPHDELRKLDRETILATQTALKNLKRRVDRSLLRLSFVDDQRLN